MSVHHAVLDKADCDLLTLKENKLRLLGEPTLKARYSHLSIPKTPQSFQRIVASFAPPVEGTHLGTFAMAPLHRPHLLQMKMHRR